MGGGGGGGGRVCTGFGAIFPQKILKSRGSEMVFSAFYIRYFLSKSFRQFFV